MDGTACWVVSEETALLHRANEDTPGPDLI